MNAGYLSLYPKGNLTGGIADLEQHWLQINSNRQIYKKIPFNILKDKSIYDTKPLRATVTNFVNGRSVQRPVVIGVTNIGSGTQEQLDERVVDQDLISTVMASSAIPVVFPPITLPNGQLYSDGGTTANSIVLQGIDRCPANAPIELDIVVCDPTLSELTPTKTQDLGFIQLALRAAEIVYKSWNSNFLRFKCDSGQDSRVKARLFSPIGTDNGWSALDFTHAKEMIESGLLRPKVDSFDFCP